MSNSLGSNLVSIGLTEDREDDRTDKKDLNGINFPRCIR